MKTYLPSLDGLRLLAVLLVYVHHHPWLRDDPTFGLLQREGWFGVDLFLALSAFLFARLLSLEHATTGRVDTGRFYMRRILRIWPAYFAYLGACAILHAVSQPGGAPPPLGRLATLATFTDDFAAALHGMSTLFGTAHLWTISYEEQFYLLLPPVLWIASRTPSRIRVLLGSFLLAGAFALKAATIHGPGQPAVWVLPWSHFESVLLGALLGLGRLDRLLRPLPSWAPAALATLALALLCALPPEDLASNWLFAKHATSAIAATLWIRSAVAWEPLAAILSRSWTVHLGKRSYGLYLYHAVAILAAETLGRRLPASAASGAISFVLGLVLAWAAAYISYRWLESPFLRLKRRWEVVPSRPV